MLAVSSLPLSAMAAQSVTPVPKQDGAADLNVEYFNSTLYNWDEAKANAAAAKKDTITETTYTNQQSFTTSGWGSSSPTISWSDLASKDVTDGNTNGNTNYFVHHVADNKYYPVYITRTSETRGNIITTTTYSYTLTRKDEREAVASETGEKKSYSSNISYSGTSYPTNTTGEYTTIDSTTNAVALYTETTTTDYAGKGFYFTDTSAGKPADDVIPAFSKWVNVGDSNGKAKQNYHIYSGLAATKLSESTNKPFNTAAVNAPNLFDTTGNDYTAVYTNVGVPFIYDPTTGYYSMNSDMNAVYFENGEGKSNTQLKIADLPVAFTSNASLNTPMTGFQPFKKIDSTTSITDAAIRGVTGEGTSAYRVTSPVYGFGMVTQVNFQMTDDGKSALTGDPIEFRFTGDDDVWVYVDGVLALDLGGTHDAIKGVIDFSTGAVTVSAPKYGKIGDKAGDTDLSESPTESELSQGNLYTKLNTTLTGFASQGNHTLTVYYMDRGQGGTNCGIKFNLPQKDTVSVTKQITQSKDNNGKLASLTAAEQATVNNADFTFTLFNGATPVTNKTYYIYDQNNMLIRAASTTSSGTFALKNNQTAKFNVEIGENSSYHVEEELTDAYAVPEFSCTTNITGASKAGSNAANASMTVTATGSADRADSIAFTCTNFLKKQADVSIIPADDRIVIDYGLPIRIDALRNDVYNGGQIKLTDVTGAQYGKAECNDDGTITYTLTKPLDGIEKLTYTASVTNDKGEVLNTAEDTPATATATISIIPATSMYYEENFGDGTDLWVKYSNGTVKWEPEGTATSNDYQETGYVGDDTDSTYGTDAAYLDDQQDSNGTVMHASATKDLGLNAAAQFTYDFTGTGTTIYGRISPTTGYIQVKVTKLVNGEESGKSTYRNIDTVVKSDGGELNTLYNIPIYSDTDLPYGTYRVRVILFNENALDKECPDFYLDGIRVYDPLGMKNVDTETTSATYQAAEKAYAADGEANVVIMNIRDKVITDYESVAPKDGEFITLTDTDNNITDVGTYSKIGPKNELYLKKSGQVSFKLLNWDSTKYHIYLGLKAPEGMGAAVNIGDSGVTVNNSADCYYDISKYVIVKTDMANGISEGTVTVKGDTGLVSLTNIKITGTDAFDIGGSEDIGGDSENPEISEEMLYMVPVTFSMAPAQPDPEPEQPEQPEKPEQPEQPEKPEQPEQPEQPESFAPAVFKANCLYGRWTKLATVTVTASSDVDHVTVNGENVRGIRLGGVYVYTYFARRVSSGTTFDVVAYNADGVASETRTVTAK